MEQSVLMFLLLLCIFGWVTGERPIQISEEDEPTKNQWNQWNILKDKEDRFLSFCESWRFGVETNTVRDWQSVPSECKDYVQNYMMGDQYFKDMDLVAGHSISYADSLGKSEDGLDAWVFDIDETLLSNLPYYSLVGFGAQSFNESSFNSWVEQSDAPAIGASQRLYLHLLELGFRIFLLTGRDEAHRNVTVKNLQNAGYHSWETLMLRADEDKGKKAVVYKSERRSKIEANGFRIRGNSGDQWSDLSGYSCGDRTFKIPNPMYFIA